MDDLISRQAAIDALADYIHNIDKVYSTGKLSAYDCKDAAKSVLDDLPSAQPEPDKLHPKVDPNFSSCGYCVHSEDSEEICILRRCVHAIAQLKECYIKRRQDG